MKRETKPGPSLIDWQIAKVAKAVAEAERGDFATDEEIQRTVDKWLHREK